MKIIVRSCWQLIGNSQCEFLASAVDFWALGICLFQFLVGVTPFNDDCPRAVIANILNSRIQWPEEDEEQLDDDAMQVIKGLLNYDPNLRLQLEGKSPPVNLLPFHR